MTKQTTGLVICAALVGEKILDLFFEKIWMKHDVEWKNEIRIITCRIFGITIPVFGFLIYLLVSHSFEDFLDYCILGINTFSNKKSYMNLVLGDNSVISVLAIFIPIMFLVTFYWSMKKNDKNLFFMLCMSIAEFIVVYPISDNIHFLIAALPMIICMIYIFYNEINLSKFEKSNKKFMSIFQFFAFEAVVLVLFLSANDILDFHEQDKNFSTLNHFKNVTIGKDFEENIRKVDEFIEKSDKKVYILNFDAAIYMIPIDRYNKNYDMFLNGNIGSKGENGQIENIKNEDAMYLIVKDGISRNWQNPENVRKFVQENMQKKGEIESFEIYEN